VWRCAWPWWRGARRATSPTGCCGHQDPAGARWWTGFMSPVTRLRSISRTWPSAPERPARSWRRWPRAAGQHAARQPRGAASFAGERRDAADRTPRADNPEPLARTQPARGRISAPGPDMLLAPRTVSSTEHRRRTLSAEEYERSRSALAGQSSGRSITGPGAYSLDHRGREEDQRSCYGTQAYRYQRGARPGLDIRSGHWRRRIETERSRHVMPPENLEIDGVPAEYPDDPADPAQPSHRQGPVSDTTA
jgi:hypothetical protein